MVPNGPPHDIVGQAVCTRFIVERIRVRGCNDIRVVACCNFKNGSGEYLKGL